MWLAGRFPLGGADSGMIPRLMGRPFAQHTQDYAYAVLRTMQYRVAKWLCCA